MKQNPQTYEKLVNEFSPKTNIRKNCLMAFLFGGLLCAIGQLAFSLCLGWGLDEKTAGSVSSLVLIFIASLLTALNVFDSIGKLAGAGTLVPITGFANSVVSSGMEFQTEGLIFGTGGKIFNIAGPVIVYGTLFSVIYGIVAVLFDI